MKIVGPYIPPQRPVKIAFVVEAPTAEDLTNGMLLTGSDGRVFNAMMRSANIDRDEVMITSVYNTRPPDDDAKKAGWLKDDERTAEALARLTEQFAEVRPDVIVPLGHVALWAFTEADAIANYRGAVTPATRIVPGAKLLPTMAPITVQRAWHWLTIVTGDLVKAGAEADIGPAITYPKVELLIEPTIADIRRFVPYAEASPKLSIDIETGWGQITSISFAPTTKLALAIPFVDLRKPNKSYWRTAEEEFEAWRLVQHMCELPNPKVGQNFMYDIMWLYGIHGIGVRNYRFDTRIRHKVLRP